MATYRTLVSLYLPGDVWVDAGTVISDQPGAGVPIPAGWPPPTGAVQPLDADATQKLWQQGPRGQSDAEIGRAGFMNGQRWSNIAVAAATTYWVRADPKNVAAGFVLHGGGENHGVFPQV